MKFLMNAWYMAGWADELVPGRLLARTFLDEPVVMFLDAQGHPVALQDRCPHRIVPLSKGVLVDGALQCGYHGLRFDAAGRCVANPHGPVPSKAGVRAYPLVERHGVLWVWMGDAQRADLTVIPDLSVLHGAPESACSRGAMPTACHYQLIIDNVADLSHVEYLHSRSLGGGAFVGARPQVSESGRQIRITVVAEGVQAPPVYAQFLDDPLVPVRFLNEVVWEPVGVLRLNIEVHPTGGGGTSLRTDNVHIVTPETGTSSHYWYWLTRSFRQDDRDASQRRGEQMFNVFLTEDKPMLEAQQALLKGMALFDAKPLLLATDAGPVRIRRTLDRLFVEELEGARSSGATAGTDIR